MLPDLLAALTLAFPIVNGPAGVAHPCGYEDYDDFCEEVEHWFSIEAHNADRIPSDGVLVLSGLHYGSWDTTAVARIDVEVAHDGQPLAGRVEIGPLAGVLVWRPDAPWMPGATYSYHATVMQDDEPAAQCAPDMIEAIGELIVDSEPGAPLGTPVSGAEVRVEVDPSIALTNLACCEGEAPGVVDGYCENEGIFWDVNVCAPIQGTGWLYVSTTVSPAAEGPAADQIVYTRKVDGLPDLRQLERNFTVELQRPFCIEIEALDLASGVTTKDSRRCFGADVVEQLGPQTIAPPEDLTCPLQRCQTTEGRWDLEHCIPYGPQPAETEAETTGCGCATSPHDSRLLALFGVLGLAWRRRGRTADP